MFKLNFKQQMISIIITQTVFLLLIFTLFFMARGNLAGFEKKHLEYQNKIAKTVDLIFYIQTYLREEINFEKLKQKKEELNVSSDLLEKIWTDLKDIHRIRTENKTFIKNIEELTDISIQNSNEYISNISQRLADPSQRKTVSTIERLVIMGALTNTNSAYKIREGIYKIKDDLSHKKFFLAFLETLIANSEEDIKSLKGTEFVNLPAEAAKSNKKVKEISIKYINNLKQNSILGNTIDQDLSKLLSSLNNENFHYTADIFIKLRSISRALIIFTMLVSLIIIILLIRNLTKIYKNIGTSPDKIEEISDKIAAGNLQGYIEPANTKGVYRSIIEMNNHLVKIIQEIINSSNTIAFSSEEMKANAEQVSQGASEQAASTEEVSATMEEITANIERSKDIALTTESTVKKTAEGIKLSNKTMLETIEAMQKIADKVKIINDIAFQTNILAINAAVEASNAGEAGKGFSVVAREVGVLAENSKQAAIEIEDLSAASVQKALEAGEILEKILPEIEKTVTLITEVVGANMEQFAGAKQINMSIQQLNDITQLNAAASEEISASIMELAQQTERLKEIASYFKIDTIIKSV